MRTRALAWDLALRYLRARRQEGFISVVAVISLVGILLGVATLIIVMAVMNGFRHELLGRILGVNGHVTIFPLENSIDDYAPLSERLRLWGGVGAGIWSGAENRDSPLHAQDVTGRAFLGFSYTLARSERMVSR